MVRRGGRPHSTATTQGHTAPQEGGAEDHLGRQRVRPLGEAQWRRAGLEDFDEPFAHFLLAHGIWPGDLRIPVRGTAAVKRFRSGEASWAVLVAELHEARDAVEAPKRPLPFKAVTWRLRGA